MINLVVDTMLYEPVNNVGFGVLTNGPNKCMDDDMPLMLNPYI
jgi:hypothetical protein